MWRTVFGVLAGVALTIALYGSVTLYTMVAVGGGSAADTAMFVLSILIWTVAAVGIGALAGRIAGRLEPLVAFLSGLTGLIILALLPDVFADVVIIVFFSIPFLLLVLFGSLLPFCARRPDMQ